MMFRNTFYMELIFVEEEKIQCYCGKEGGISKIHNEDTEGKLHIKTIINCKECQEKRDRFFYGNKKRKTNTS